MPYRDPDQLPRVLLNLLDLKNLRVLLKQPQTLANFLDKQGWAPIPEEEVEDGPWPGSLAPDSQEAAEEAELMPMAEAKLAELELTPQEKQALRQALIQTCPACEGMAMLLIPTRSFAAPM